MIEAAAAGQVLLMAYFNMRFHPIVNAIDRIIADIGPIYASRISYTQFRTAVNWRHQLEQGGGVLKSQGVHPIDLATHWIGAVATVSGEMMIVHPEREVEDFALVMLRFQSGAVGEIYTCYTDRQEEAMSGDLQGAAGKISFVLSPYKPELNHVILQRGKDQEVIPLRQPDSADPVYPGLMDCSKLATEHFVQCVETRRSSPLNGILGRQSIEIVLAAYESQRRQARIHLPLNDFDTESLHTCFPHFNTGGYTLVD
jgi:predicted dehydrogenase